MTEIEHVTSAADSAPQPPSAAPAASTQTGRGVGAPPGVAAMLASIMQALLLMAATGLIAFAGSIEPESAVHEIYQLNLASTGLMLIAVVGIWAAIDALRRDR